MNDDHPIVNLKSKILNPLFLLLLIFSGLTLLNSVMLPLGEAPDETDHYQYHHFVARAGHPPLTDAEREEAGFKGGLAPLYYWLTAWPIALIGPDTSPNIRRVDARPERHIPTDGLDINHVLHTLDEAWPWQGQVLAWHLVRLLSLPMGWVTIIATYTLARRLQPGSPGMALVAAGFVAFLPRFVISSAVINDDNLVFALTALLLLAQVTILQRTGRSPHPPSLRSPQWGEEHSSPPAGGNEGGQTRPWLFAAVGALFGLALVTKYFSLILLPEVLFTLWLAARRLPRPRVPLTAFAAALAATAGPWFAFITVRFNRISELGLIPGLAASLGEPQITEGLVGLLAGQSVRPPAATYALPDWFGLLYRSFWFEFGWMQIFAPGWVYGLFSAAVVIIIGLTVWRITTVPDYSPRSVTEWGAKQSGSEAAIQRFSTPINLLLMLHLSLFLIVVLARYILSATIDTGQGRHLFPALPVIAVAIGWAYQRGKVTQLPSGTSQTPGSQFTIHNSQFIIFTLATVCFLGGALYTLIPATIILPRYQTRPVTQTPPSVPHPQNLPLADGLRLTGLDAPPAATAGTSLPVTLYWQATREAKQEYLQTLCLVDEREQPAACWSGLLTNGRYPARAWEAGDTIIDRVAIPVPACDRLENQQHRLRLTVYPLNPELPEPTPLDAPTWQHTFAEPVISLEPGSGPVAPMELWHGGQRLTTATSQSVSLHEVITIIDYSPDSPAPALSRAADGSPWRPALTTPLTSPCPARQSSFIAGPTLPPGDYQLEKFSLTFAPRHRIFGPVEPTLTFADTLAPLSLSLPGQPALSLPPATPPRLTLAPAVGSLPVTIRWQARRWMTDPLVISLKLLDKDFDIGGERVATLGDRYPNVLWTPTELITETYPVRLKPDAPPGLYRLELSVVHQDENQPDGFEYLPILDGESDLGYNLYPALIRLLDPAHDAPPPVPLAAQLGESIHLTGYEATPLTADAPLALTLYWRASAAIATDYTVFTQLLGPDGQVWAQWDNPPQAGRYPTSAWSAADTVVDRYRLTLREGAPPGDYRLLVGMYDPQTGQRLPVTVDGQPQPNDAVELRMTSEQ